MISIPILLTVFFSFIELGKAFNPSSQGYSYEPIAPSTKPFFYNRNGAERLVSCRISPLTVTTSYDTSLSTSSAAEELLSLVITNFNADNPPQNLERIDYLINFLQDQNIPFDPTKCLNGPLYAVLHQSGPQPFWEKYDIGIGKKKSIKGQRYTRNKDGNYDLLNYAELFGDSVIAQATGVCRKNRIDFDQDTENDTSTAGEFMLKCPADFTIQANGASLRLFGYNFSFDIKGTGHMRMLYADQNLRILTAPKDTRSTKDLIDEKAGLTVVQVRIDLLDPIFSLS